MLRRRLLILSAKTQTSIWTRTGLTLLAVLAMVSLRITPLYADPDAAPTVKVKATLAEALTILHDQQAPVEQRRTNLIKLAEANLDLKRMAQGSLGDQWTQLSPAERDDFVGLFTAFIEVAYLVQIQEYVQLNIAVTKGRMINPDFAEVDAIVHQPHEEDLPITFLLERRGNDWIVYDVNVEGVSMVQNYRTQFTRVIKKEGLPALMSDLRDKQKSLAGLIGQTG